jgi:hypothetical protein
MLAAKTTVPVLGVPVASRHLQGVDSLHSIVQMPKGIPVATFAIGTAGAANAALFVVAMLANEDAALRAKLEAFRARQTERARAMTRRAQMTRSARSSRPARRSASWAAASSAACSCTPRSRWATRPRCSTPIRQPGRPRRARPHPQPTTSTPPAWRSWPR